jgi:hypothetical protein
MDIPSTLVLLVVGAGILAWVTSPRTAQALEAFGLGFIGYRGPGWPKGVQEEEPIHFAFHEPRDPDAPAGPDELPEIIEL